mmetsp:Transcript_19833/g.55147  ORF Transcript_19833/g.55147 Transcript_19833/m.55147 type:complete len:290 (-) Transcript_19833:287-1156(-)|eukprot:CAMPEP_0117669094 /NCGR_PEP_ID=MMETSP0804-20121206/11925_1 /TAXON_ID=1074897 /ORGANISM="Tetraselmis astigmatica, Strain CCMP880" /LENGTH=289 /DNA_ID=CAMNT_0005477081 /DNA_START=362 /DNA_END=1231 /DNA_ORIENTATION=+
MPATTRLTVRLSAAPAGAENGVAQKSAYRSSSRLRLPGALLTEQLRVFRRGPQQLQVPVPTIEPRSARTGNDGPTLIVKGGGRGPGDGGRGGDGDDGDSEGGHRWDGGVALASLWALVSTASASPAVQKCVQDSILCCGTFALADVLAHLLQGGCHQDLDWQRVWRLAFFGLLIKGPSMSWFYKAVDSSFPGNSVQRVMQKVMVDQTCWSWVNNAAFLFLLPVMEGRSFEDAAGVVKQDFFTLQRNAYMLWPLAHIVNFACIPAGGRSLYVSAVSLTWSTMCCTFRGRA